MYLLRCILFLKQNIYYAAMFTVFSLFITGTSCKKIEKEQAFNFLKANMAEKVSSEKKLVSNSGTEILFSPYDFESLYQAKDSLKKLIENNLEFSCIYKDPEVVSDSFIYKHVQQILKFKKESTGLKQAGDNIFFEFVLPYRGGDEIFTDYHSTIEHIFSKTVANLPQNATTQEKVMGINSKLIEILEFDLRSHAELKEPSVVEVLETGKGSCNSLTSATAQAMRYFGIPIAIDECPVWGHRNSGHRWNAFLSENSDWIPFEGADKNPEEFNCINDSVKAPKILRHTFSSQKSFQPPVATYF